MNDSDGEEIELLVEHPETLGRLSLHAPRPLTTDEAKRILGYVDVHHPELRPARGETVDVDVTFEMLRFAADAEDDEFA